MDPVTLLIVALVCAAVGFLVGILVSTLKGDRETSEVQMDAAAKAPALSTRVEVARFFRDRPGDPIQVELGGKTYGNAIELDNSQRDDLEDLLIEAGNFLGRLSAYSNAGTQPAGYEDQAYAEPAPAFSTPVYTPALASSALNPAQPAAPPAAPARSIVGQIDDILQDKLAGTIYANQGIRLSESPNQGAVVMIGRTAYPGIDEIPDPEIKNLIRQSVAAWESRAK